MQMNLFFPKKGIKSRIVGRGSKVPDNSSTLVLLHFGQRGIILPPINTPIRYPNSAFIVMDRKHSILSQHSQLNNIENSTNVKNAF
jgi:hypothetical protein